MKTFKSDSELAKTISVSRRGDRILIEIEDPKHLIAINISDNNAPALALAILEAAGHVRDACSDNDADVAMEWLHSAIARQAKQSAEAKEQAELESEALELFNAAREEIAVGTYGVYEQLDNHSRRKWLAVARRAREMRTEK